MDIATAFATLLTNTIIAGTVMYYSYHSKNSNNAFLAFILLIVCSVSDTANGSSFEWLNWTKQFGWHVSVVNRLVLLFTILYLNSSNVHIHHSERVIKVILSLIVIIGFSFTTIVDIEHYASANNICYIIVLALFVNDLRTQIPVTLTEIKEDK